ERHALRSASRPGRLPGSGRQSLQRRRTSRSTRLAGRQLRRRRTPGLPAETSPLTSTFGPISPKASPRDRTRQWSASCRCQDDDGFSVIDMMLGRDAANGEAEVPDGVWIDTDKVGKVRTWLAGRAGRWLRRRRPGCHPAPRRSRRPVPSQCPWLVVRPADRPPIGWDYTRTGSRLPASSALRRCAKRRMASIDVKTW
ncbi:MAG: hypothetical protein QOH97_2240, partial [Actinoplanes sp.]|nr:hypothetical protein [Actinoplanes sp.]